MIPSPVALVGADGAILIANAAWHRLFHPHGSNGRGLGDFFAEAASALGEVLRSGETCARRALPLASSRDVKIWCDLDLVPHPDASGMVLIFARDVTDHVLARRDAEDQRQALAPTDARLRLAGAATGIGTWEWDTIRNRLAWSPEHFRLHGLDPASASPPSLAQWLDIIHPEDRSRIERAPSSGFNRTRDATYEVEFRIRRCDTGVERHLRSLCQVMEWTADDAPAQLLGVTVDVTEQRNEQATQHAHQAMVRLAASAARVFAWDWDLATGRSPGATALKRRWGCRQADLAVRWTHFARWSTRTMPPPSKPRYAGRSTVKQANFGQRFACCGRTPANDGPTPAAW